jgi:alkylated DNA repair dioxygenase AlkB
VDWRLFPGWLAGDEELLPALRGLYSYDGAGRATGWLLLQDRPPVTPWPEPFAGLGLRLLGDLEETTGIRFTAACFQAYLDGAGCDWHRDPEWAAQAIVSLGVTRSFGLRNDGGRAFIPLAHGDLLVMPPGFQDGWEHCVPVEQVKGERCSIVFRSAA